MDGATTTIIILVFVFSIFGAATDKKNEPKNYPVSQEVSAPSSTVHTSVEVDIPSELFAAGYVEGLSNKIKDFVSRYGKNVPESDAQQIGESVAKYSQLFDVNPRLVTALIARESRFNKYAISSSGAQGLGQLLPSTSAGLNIADPFDIDENIKGTTRYIKSMLDRFSGPNKVPYAIAGYFEGPNAVARNGGFKPKSKSYVEDILTIYKKI